MKWLLWISIFAASLQGAREDVLLRADEDFAKAAAQRGAEGFVSFFAEDAVILPAKVPVVEGKASIAEVYRKVWEAPGFSLAWKPLKAVMARAGDLGYTYGTYERKHTEGGRTVVETGKYLTIWKRQPGGSWKVVLDMGN
jgi:ketosteroid isomerase-like protein